MRIFFTCITTLILIFSLCACLGDEKIREIEFPQIVQELHDSVLFDFDIGDQKDMMGKELPLYKIVRRRTAKNEQYYDGCLFKVFTGSINETVKQDGFTKYVCNDGDSLEIYNEGSYIFTRKRSSREILEASDQEIVSLAEKYLKENALLPDGFTAGRTLGGTYNADGTPIMRSVGFYHKINGYEVYGRSDITVEIDSYGVRAVYSIYSDYEFEKNVRCLSYEDILDIDPLREGQIIYDPTELKGEIDNVIITDLKIMYYDSPINQPELNYIQPIYQFKGTAFDVDGNTTDYYWTISAIVGCSDTAGNTSMGTVATSTAKEKHTESTKSENIAGTSKTGSKMDSEPGKTGTAIGTDGQNKSPVPPKSSDFTNTEDMLSWVNNGEYADCAFKQAARRQDFLIIPKAANASFKLEEIVIGHTNTHIVYIFKDKYNGSIHWLVNLPVEDKESDSLETYISDRNNRMREQYDGHCGLYKNGELFLMGKNRETYKQDCGLATDRKTGKDTPIYAEFITEIEGCIVKITLRENLLQNNWDNSLLDNFRITKQILQP